MRRSFVFCDDKSMSEIARKFCLNLREISYKNVALMISLFLFIFIFIVLAWYDSNRMDEMFTKSL